MIEENHNLPLHSMLIARQKRGNESLFGEESATMETLLTKQNIPNFGIL